MSDHIPNEILIEILSRLPVKALLRFTAVSKPWQALITNPSFITTHLHQSTQNTQNQPTHKPHLLRVYTNTDKKEHYFLFNPTDENPGDEFEFLEIDFPFKSKVGYFRIVGSCNGLMCLCDDYFNDAHTTFVWNPSVRKSVRLPEAKRPPGPHMFVLGFGFDPKKASEFKVVRVVYEKYPMGRFGVPPKAEVYSQGALSWRELNLSSASVISCCMVEFVWSQAFLNGAVHWVAHNPSLSNGMFMNMIMMFDMGDEVFKEMSLPPVLAEERPACLSVASFGGGSLAVLCGGSDVWVMKEYGVCESWTKLYSVQLPDVMDRVLGFRRNGEVLLSTRDNWFISYDPETKEISNTGISGSLYSFKVEPYMETLLLLNEPLNGPERVQLPEGQIE